MIPVSLRLTGSVHIKSGLAVDTLTIDFSKFQPGLIAFIGQNGAGKTTIIEHATPYPQMASYQSRKYSDHFFLKNSEKDFHWIYNGIKYRTYFQIDGVTGKAKYFLYKEDKPLNQDGGLSSYTEQVERILGSADLFFKSQFTAQKATNIGSLEPSERKKIFMEILSIDKYAQYHKYIKEQTDKIETDLETSRNELAVYSADLQNLETLQSEMESITQQISEKQTNLTFNTQSLKDTEKKKTELELKMGELKANLEILDKEKKNLFSKEIDTLLPFRAKHKERLTSFQQQQEALEASQAGCNLILARKEQILIEIQSHKIEIDNLQLAITSQDRIIADRGLLEKEITDLTTKESEMKNKYENEISNLKFKISELAPKIERAEKIIANKENINTNKTRLDELRIIEKGHAEKQTMFYQKSQLIQKATANYTDEFTKWTQLKNTFDTELVSLRHTFETKDRKRNNDLANIQAQIDMYRNSASLIDQKPENDPPEMYSICKLLTSAIEAKNKVEDLEAHYLSPMLKDDFPLKVELAKLEIKINETRQTLLIHELAKPTRDAIVKLEQESEAIGYDTIVHNRTKTEITKIENENWEKLYNELASTEELYKLNSNEKKELELSLHIETDELSKEQTWFTNAITERQTKLSAIPVIQNIDEARATITRLTDQNESETKSIITAETTLAGIIPQLQQISKDRGIEILQFTEEESKLLREIETLKSEIEILSATHQDIIRINTETSENIRQIDGFTRTIETLQQETEQLRNSQTQTQSKILSAEQMKQRTDTIQLSINSNLTKLSKWNILKDACSPNGIPQIEIDAAAPGVSQIVNQELQDTFGNEFKVRFITLEPYADESKGMKEVFEIMIQQNGMEERKIKDFSGGQAVWINRSIADALAVYSMRKEGKHSQTNFLDESDGALDPENKQRYFQMLHNAFRTGKRHFTILITHDPNIQSQIQQRIKFNKGNSTTPIEYSL